MAGWWRSTQVQARAHRTRSSRVEAALGPAEHGAGRRFLGLRAQQFRAHIIGVSVSDTMPEMMTASDRVMANSRNSRPTTPPISSSGMNTAISEIVRETIVKPIWLRAFQRGMRPGFSPASM